MFCWNPNDPFHQGRLNRVIQKLWKYNFALILIAEDWLLQHFAHAMQNVIPDTEFQQNRLFIGLYHSMKKLFKSVSGPPWRLGKLEAKASILISHEISKSRGCLLPF